MIKLACEVEVSELSFTVRDDRTVLSLRLPGENILVDAVALLCKVRPSRRDDDDSRSRRDAQQRRQHVREVEVANDIAGHLRLHLRVLLAARGDLAASDVHDTGIQDEGVETRHAELLGEGIDGIKVGRIKAKSTRFASDRSGFGVDGIREWLRFVQVAACHDHMAALLRKHARARQTHAGTGAGNDDILFRLIRDIIEVERHRSRQ